METEQLLKREKRKPYNTLGSIIQGWKENKSQAFGKMLIQFIPPPATIIDLCSGDKRMYHMLNKGCNLNGNYKFIFGDIREIKDNDFICDVRDPPKELYGKADGVILDPPWNTQSGTLKHILHAYKPMKKDEFKIFLFQAINGLHKVLKKKGTMIFKISHPYNHMIYSYLDGNGYKWVRDIVQLNYCAGIPLCCYWMIFKKTGGVFTPSGVAELGLNGSATAPPKDFSSMEKSFV